MVPKITRVESDEFETVHAVRGRVGDDGTVPVPDGPGIDDDYDWDHIEANQTGSVHNYE